MLAEHVGRPRIGYTIFELDTFNAAQKHHLSKVDILWVPTNWAKRVVEDNGIKTPTDVIPLGVDRQIFNENVNGGLQKTNKTRFFHCGKIEVRKGHEFLHEVFRKAFGPADPVELIISWHNPFLSREEVDQWQAMYKDVLGNQVSFIPWLQSQEELASLIASCDVGLFPSLSEGWGLPLIDCMSMGKTVITTNYSGHTQFVNEANALLIQPTELEEAVDGKWFFGEGRWLKWTKEQEEQLVHYLRIAHKLKQSGSVGPNVAAIETAKKFSWSNTVEMMELALESRS